MSREQNIEKHQNIVFLIDLQYLKKENNSVVADVASNVPKNKLAAVGMLHATSLIT